MKISINAHSSIRIETDKVIRFDPFEIKEKVNDSDIIFFTHDHYDHYSPEDVAKVRKEDTIFVFPKSCERNILASGLKGEYVALSPGDNVEVNGYKVSAVPAYNMVKLFHTKGAKFLGYIIEIEGEKVYVVGDSDMTAPVFSPKVDTILIPVGGKYTYDVKEASNYVNIIEPKCAIPTHYGSVVGKKDCGEKFKELVSPNIKVEILI